MNHKLRQRYVYSIWKIGFSSDFVLELPLYTGDTESLVKILSVRFVLPPSQLPGSLSGVLLQKSFENDAIRMTLTEDSQIFFEGILTSKIASVIILSTILPFLLATNFHMTLFHGSGCAIGSIF